jgi:hypothetical protein
LDSDEVYALLNSINFTNICGPWLLTIVPTSGSLINIGTVENGRITVTNNTVVDNEYTVIINATPISECGTFTALN